MSGNDRKTPDGAASPEDTVRVQKALLRVAHMFGEYRDDDIMRELCVLAIKAAQERLIRA